MLLIKLAYATIQHHTQGRAKRDEARQRWRVAQDSLNQLLGTERVLALHGLIHESLELLSPTEPATGADDE